MLYGMLHIYIYIYITCYIYHHIPNQQDPCFFVRFACKHRAYLLCWSKTLGFHLKPGVFSKTGSDHLETLPRLPNIPTSLEFPGFVTPFLVFFFMFDADPWLTRDYPTETLGLDRETFGKTPWFSKPVTKPWWTHDIPVKLNAGWMPQNSILFWLVFVVFSWNRSGLCLLVFGNKAPLLDGSKKVTWPELPNPEFCLKTLGFPAGPANFSGFVG